MKFWVLNDDETTTDLDLLRGVIHSSREFRNGRSLEDIHNHFVKEVKELQIEMTKLLEGHAPGADGVVGEAVDAMLCLIDLLSEHLSELTSTEVLNLVEEIAERKLAKWKRLYAASV